MTSRILACLVIAAGVFITAPARAEDPLNSHRVALVIGNAAYANVAPLRNTRADAEAVGDALRGVGFESVKVETDVTRAQLEAALTAFKDEAAKADWAVIYYAGIGVKLDGVTYLVPVDANPGSDHLKDEAVPVDRMLASLKGAKKLRLVMLDAVHEVAFAGRKGGPVSSQPSAPDDKQPAEPGAPTLLVFATSHGRSVREGHGPFAAALLKHLRTPHLEIKRMFDRVLDEVRSMTGGRQRPSLFSTPINEDLFFVK